METYFIRLEPTTNGIKLIQKSKIKDIRIHCDDSVVLNFTKSEQWKGNDGDFLPHKFHTFFMNNAKLNIKSSTNCILEITFAEKTIYDPTFRKKTPESKYWDPNEIESREKRIILSKMLEQKIQRHNRDFYNAFFHFEKHGDIKVMIIHNDYLLNPCYIGNDKIWDLPEAQHQTTLQFQKDTPQYLPRNGDCVAYMEIEKGCPTQCTVFSNGRVLFNLELGDQTVYPFILLCYYYWFSYVTLKFDEDVTVTFKYKNLPLVMKDRKLPNLVRQYGSTQLYINGVLVPVLNGTTM